jgi:hypothetical protein
MCYEIRIDINGLGEDEFCLVGFEWTIGTWGLGECNQNSLGCYTSW